MIFFHDKIENNLRGEVVKFRHFCGPKKYFDTSCDKVFW